LAWRSEKEDLIRVRAFCSDSAVVRERSSWALRESRVSSVVWGREEEEVVVVVAEVRGDSQNTAGVRRRIEDVARRIAATGPGGC